MQRLALPFLRVHQAAPFEKLGRYGVSETGIPLVLRVGLFRPVGET
jgi:hypothetical protein